MHKREVQVSELENSQQSEHRYSNNYIQKLVSHCSVVKHLDTVNVVVCRVCNYGFAPYCANVLVPMFVHSYVLVYLVTVV